MDPNEKLFSPACERNREPILAELKRLFALYLPSSQNNSLLEVGSGSGQHAVYFSSQLKLFNVTWQPSDLVENLPSIAAWMADEPEHRCLEPMALDLTQGKWPTQDYQIVFTANTLHIVALPLVHELLRGAEQHLSAGGLLLIYGPFKYDGEYTSQSNREFDAWLKARDYRSGIRDIETVAEALPNMTLLEDIVMPANNQLLVFRKRC